MKPAIFAILGAVILLGGCSGEGTGQSVEAAPGEAEPGFSIDYEKFTLDNGLEVILHVDRSDPIVAVTTVVHVGSNREKPGRTGFAHFFEHMAFNDSENVPRGWNRKAIPDWGGQRNGGTWNDGTIYFEVVPRDAFDKILWIDSDRLGYMINTVTDEALEREKQVVKNEKRQRVDNAPYGYSQEIIRKALYPEDHPYNWTVIGALPDLQAATLGDLKEFYELYYGAANATLVIAGDIDIAETREKVERWFGEIRRGPDLEPLPPMPVSLSETTSLFFEDNFAKLPELRLTFPSVEAYHDDEQALNVLAGLLAGSKNSVLHREIVETRKLAPNVVGFNNSNEIAGEFVFRVRANAGVDLDEVKSALYAALAQFREEGVDLTDLERIKAEQETGLYAGLATVLGKSNRMARDNEFGGDPAFATRAVALINAVTAEDVMAVFERYIDGKHSIITSFTPTGEAELALDGATRASVWLETVEAGVANEEVSAGLEAEYEKTPSQYDRSEPPFGALPLLKTPDIWDAQLPKGIRVLGIEHSEVPLVSFDITIEGGAWLDPVGKKGVASLLAQLMNEGTQNRTAAELEQAIGLLGSGVNVTATTNGVRINATTLSKNFEATLALIEEMLGEPRWDMADFERVKTAALTALEGRKASPTGIANTVFDGLIYGPDHPLGTPLNGTVETVSGITLADLQTHFTRMMGAGARIHIAGDISEARAVEAFEGMTDLFRAKDVDIPEYTVPEQSNAGRVFFIDVPGSKQSVLYIGKLGLPASHPDMNRLVFTNEKLGGGISGDLAQTLRIEKGYTYGASSFVQQGRVAEPFLAVTSVRANATKASLEIIRDMIDAHGPDFSQDDVETVRQKVVKRTTRASESLGAKRNMLRTISEYDKPLNYVELEQRELLAMELDAYKQTAAQYLNADEMVYLIIGDGETQREEVRAFAGGELTELDIDGKPIR